MILWLDNEHLLHSAYHNDIDSLKVILDRCDVNVRNQLGQTALHIASCRGYSGIVRVLLDQSTMLVNLADEESRWTVLHYCAYYGHIELLNEIMSHRRFAAKAKSEPLNLQALDRDGHTYYDLLRRTVKPLAGPTITVMRMFVSSVSATNEQEFRPLAIKGTVMAVGQNAVLDFDARTQISRRVSLETRGVTETHEMQQFAVKKVVMSDTHTLMLIEDGKVYSMGINVSCQLGYVTDKHQVTAWQKVRTPKKVFMDGVACSRQHSVAFSDTQLHVWGLNKGQLGLSATTGDISEPRTLTLQQRIIQVACAVDQTVILFESGDVNVLVDHTRIQVVMPATAFYNPQWRVKSHRSLDTRAKMVRCNTSMGACLSSDGMVFVWKYVRNGTSVAAKAHKLMALQATIDTDSIINFEFTDIGTVVFCTQQGLLYTAQRHGKRYQCQRVDFMYNVCNFMVSGMSLVVETATSMPVCKIGMPAVEAHDISYDFIVQIQTSDGLMTVDNVQNLRQNCQFVDIVLQSEWRIVKNGAVVVELSRVSSVQMHMILQIVNGDVTGLVSLNDVEQLCSLLTISNQLIMPHTKSAVACRLQALITTDNVKHLLKISKVHRCKELYEYLLDFMVSQIAYVTGNAQLFRSITCHKDLQQRLRARQLPRYQINVPMEDSAIHYRLKAPSKPDDVKSPSTAAQNIDDTTKELMLFQLDEQQVQPQLLVEHETPKKILKSTSWAKLDAKPFVSMQTIMTQQQVPLKPQPSTQNLSFSGRKSSVEPFKSPPTRKLSFSARRAPAQDANQRMSVSPVHKQSWNNQSRTSPTLAPQIKSPAHGSIGSSSSTSAWTTTDATVQSNAFDFPSLGGGASATKSSKFKSAGKTGALSDQRHQHKKTMLQIQQEDVAIREIETMYRSGAEPYSGAIFRVTTRRHQ